MCKNQLKCILYWHGNNIHCLVTLWFLGQRVTLAWMWFTTSRRSRKQRPWTSWQSPSGNAVVEDSDSDQELPLQDLTNRQNGPTPLPQSICSSTTTEPPRWQSTPHPFLSRHTLLRPLSLPLYSPHNIPLVSPHYLPFLSQHALLRPLSLHLLSPLLSPHHLPFLSSYTFPSSVYVPSPFSVHIPSSSSLHIPSLDNIPLSTLAIHPISHYPTTPYPPPPQSSYLYNPHTPQAHHSSPTCLQCNQCFCTPRSHHNEFEDSEKMEAESDWVDFENIFGSKMMDHLLRSKQMSSQICTRRRLPRQILQSHWWRGATLNQNAQHPTVLVTINTRKGSYPQIEWKQFTLSSLEKAKKMPGKHTRLQLIAAVARSIGLVDSSSSWIVQLLNIFRHNMFILLLLFHSYRPAPLCIFYCVCSLFMFDPASIQLLWLYICILHVCLTHSKQLSTFNCYCIGYIYLWMSLEVIYVAMRTKLRGSWLKFLPQIHWQTNVSKPLRVWNEIHNKATECTRM